MQQSSFAFVFAIISGNIRYELIREAVIYLNLFFFILIGQVTPPWVQSQSDNIRSDYSDNSYYDRHYYPEDDKGNSNKTSEEDQTNKKGARLPKGVGTMCVL